MKPLCELCSSRHETYQAHIFATNAVVNRKPVVNAAVVNAKRKPGKYRDAEARKTYLREYMRKRRAGLR